LTQIFFFTCSKIFNIFNKKGKTTNLYFPALFVASGIRDNHPGSATLEKIGEGERRTGKEKSLGKN
jgi:hypothetical protein